MPTPTYELINTIELAASTGAITFSNIPQNYVSLIIDVRGNSANQYQLRLNGSSGASLIYMDSTGSSFASGTSTEASMWYNPSNSDIISRNYVIDYTDITKTKTIITRAFTVGGPNSFYVSRWNSTAAVTSLLLFNNSGSLGAGSVIDVFGVRG
jgi:hypothetical protein